MAVSDMDGSQSMASESIDFVVPWVDGSDPEWLNARRSFLPVGDADVYTCDARYRDWGLIRFFFRSVDKFAPWVRKVHLITWGHLPSWLNVDNPRLNIVNHRDYIPERFLPTFNSNVIELNVHRISDLSERFVLFNDDLVLLRTVQPHDFFRKGLPCASAILLPQKIDKDNQFYAAFNNVALINAHFEKNRAIGLNFIKWFNPIYGLKNNLKTASMMPFDEFYGFTEYHLANSYLKSTFEEVWEEEPEALERTCSHHMRDPRDCSHWLMENWQFAKGSFAPRKPSFGKSFYLHGENERLVREDIEKAVEYIESSSGPMVCINDGPLSESMLDLAVSRITSAFESILPEKSSFER